MSLRLLAALSELTMDEREVFIDRHLRGDTLQAVANRMGKYQKSRTLTREAVRLWERSAKQKLEASPYLFGVREEAA